MLGRWRPAGGTPRAPWRGLAGPHARLGMPLWSLSERTGGTPHACLGMPLWSLSERTGGTPRAPWDGPLETLKEDHALGCLSARLGSGGARLAMPLLESLFKNYPKPPSSSPWRPLAPLKRSPRGPLGASSEQISRTLTWPKFSILAWLCVVPGSRKQAGHRVGRTTSWSKQRVLGRNNPCLDKTGFLSEAWWQRWWGRLNPG